MSVNSAGKSGSNFAKIPANESSSSPTRSSSPLRSVNRGDDRYDLTNPTRQGSNQGEASFPGRALVVPPSLPCGTSMSIALSEEQFNELAFEQYIRQRIDTLIEIIESNSQFPEAEKICREIGLYINGHSQEFSKFLQTPLAWELAFVLGRVLEREDFALEFKQNFVANILVEMFKREEFLQNFHAITDSTLIGKFFEQLNKYALSIPMSQPMTFKLYLVQVVDILIKVMSYRRQNNLPDKSIPLDAGLALVEKILDNHLVLMQPRESRESEVFWDMIRIFIESQGTEMFLRRGIVANKFLTVAMWRLQGGRGTENSQVEKMFFDFCAYLGKKSEFLSKISSDVARNVLSVLLELLKTGNLDKTKYVNLFNKLCSDKKFLSGVLNKENIGEMLDELLAVAEASKDLDFIKTYLFETLFVIHELIDFHKPEIKQKWEDLRKTTTLLVVDDMHKNPGYFGNHVKLVRLLVSDATFANDFNVESLKIFLAKILSRFADDCFRLTISDDLIKQTLILLELFLDKGFLPDLTKPEYQLELALTKFSKEFSKRFVQSAADVRNFAGVWQKLVTLAPGLAIDRRSAMPTVSPNAQFEQCEFQQQIEKKINALIKMLNNDKNCRDADKICGELYLYIQSNQATAADYMEIPSAVNLVFALGLFLRHEKVSLQPKEGWILEFLELVFAIDGFVQNFHVSPDLEKIYKFFKNLIWYTVNVIMSKPGSSFKIPLVKVMHILKEIIQPRKYANSLDKSKLLDAFSPLLEKILDNDLALVQLRELGESEIFWDIIRVFIESQGIEKSLSRDVFGDKCLTVIMWRLQGGRGTENFRIEKMFSNFWVYLDKEPAFLSKISSNVARKILSVLLELLKTGNLDKTKYLDIFNKLCSDKKFLSRVLNQENLGEMLDELLAVAKASKDLDFIKAHLFETLFIIHELIGFDKPEIKQKWEDLLETTALLVVDDVRKHPKYFEKFVNFVGLLGSQATFANDFNAKSLKIFLAEILSKFASNNFCVKISNELIKQTLMLLELFLDKRFLPDLTKPEHHLALVNLSSEFVKHFIKSSEDIRKFSHIWQKLLTVSDFKQKLLSDASFRQQLINLFWNIAYPSDVIFNLDHDYEDARQVLRELFKGLDKDVSSKFDVDFAGWQFLDFFAQGIKSPEMFIDAEKTLTGILGCSLDSELVGEILKVYGQRLAISLRGFLLLDIKDIKGTDKDKICLGLFKLFNNPLFARAADLSTDVSGLVDGVFRMIWFYCPQIQDRDIRTAIYQGLLTSCFGNPGKAQKAAADRAELLRDMFKVFIPSLAEEQALESSGLRGLLGNEQTILDNLLQVVLDFLVNPPSCYVDDQMLFSSFLASLASLPAVVEALAKPPLFAKFISWSRQVLEEKETKAHSLALKKLVLSVWSQVGDQSSFRQSMLDDEQGLKMYDYLLALGNFKGQELSSLELHEEALKVLDVLKEDPAFNARITEELRFREILEPLFGALSKVVKGEAALSELAHELDALRAISDNDEITGRLLGFYKERLFVLFNRVLFELSNSSKARPLADKICLLMLKFLQHPDFKRECLASEAEVYSLVQVLSFLPKYYRLSQDLDVEEQMRKCLLQVVFRDPNLRSKILREHPEYFKSLMRIAFGAPEQSYYAKISEAKDLHILLSLLSDENLWCSLTLAEKAEFGKMALKRVSLLDSFSSKQILKFCEILLLLPKQDSLYATLNAELPLIFKQILKDPQLAKDTKTKIWELLENFAKEKIGAESLALFDRQHGEFFMNTLRGSVNAAAPFKDHAYRLVAILSKHEIWREKFSEQTQGQPLFKALTKSWFSAREFNKLTDDNHQQILQVLIALGTESTFLQGIRSQDNQTILSRLSQLLETKQEGKEALRIAPTSRVNIYQAQQALLANKVFVGNSSLKELKSLALSLVQDLKSSYISDAEYAGQNLRVLLNTLSLVATDLHLHSQKSRLFRSLLAEILAELDPCLQECWKKWSANRDLKPVVKDPLLPVIIDLTTIQNKLLILCLENPSSWDFVALGTILLFICQEYKKTQKSPLLLQKSMQLLAGLAEYKLFPEDLLRDKTLAFVGITLDILAAPAKLAADKIERQELWDFLTSLLSSASARKILMADVSLCNRLLKSCQEVLKEPTPQETESRLKFLVRRMLAQLITDPDYVANSMSTEQVSLRTEILIDFLASVAKEGDIEAGLVVQSWRALGVLAGNPKFKDYVKNNKHLLEAVGKMCVSYLQEYLRARVNEQEEQRQVRDAIIQVLGSMQGLFSSKIRIELEELLSS